jgi:hypothetical protein
MFVARMERSVTEGRAVEAGSCIDCGFPVAKVARNAPCPFCGHVPAFRTAEQLRGKLYCMPLADLQRLQLGLRSDDVAGDPLDTIVDVLLALWAVSEEAATMDQLNQVIDGVTGGRLDQLPLPRFAPCFCESGRRYGKCHGRPSHVEVSRRRTAHDESHENHRRTA